MATTYDYRIENVWDNGEFLSGATVVYLENGKETEREEFVGTTEEPPGHTGLQLAQSAAASWYESMTTTLEERLGPFGLEWEREQEERYGPAAYAATQVSHAYGNDALGDFDAGDLPF